MTISSVFPPEIPVSTEIEKEFFTVPGVSPYKSAKGKMQDKKNKKRNFLLIVVILKTCHSFNS